MIPRAFIRTQGGRQQAAPLYIINNTINTRYAFFQNGIPVTKASAWVDNNIGDVPLDTPIAWLSGTVTVQECTHTGEGVCTYTHIKNTSTHTKTCLACGQTWTAENCTYTFSGATGTCAACGDSVTVVVSGTENLTYDGTEKTLGVTVTRAGTELATSDYTVAYTDNTNAGTATVTVTIGGGAYTQDFTIGKATPTIEWNPQEVTLTYTGKPANIKPVITLVNGEKYTGKIYYSWASVTDSLVLPTDVGAYMNIKASIPEHDNYNAAVTKMGLILYIYPTDQAAPAAPAAEDANIKDTSITLNTIENAEYSKDGTTWQPYPQFHHRQGQHHHHSGQQAGRRGCRKAHPDLHRDRACERGHAGHRTHPDL